MYTGLSNKTPIIRIERIEPEEVVTSSAHAAACCRFPRYWTTPRETLLADLARKRAAARFVDVPPGDDVFKSLQRIMDSTICGPGHGHRFGQFSPFRVLLCAALTLNATRQSRVTLSLR